MTIQFADRSNDANETTVATDPSIPPEASPFRIALSQLLACMAKNLLLFDLGLALGFSTIVIPVLRGMQRDRNPDETLYFSAEQSSWFGSLMFIVQPIGSVLSGWLTEMIGRKRAMLLANMPHLLAWTMLGLATSVEQVFAAGALLSIGVGLMESSTITYVGEISHPSMRGILISLSNSFVTAGISTMYVLGSVMHWRTAALCSLTLPLVTTVALIFVPETPYWLLTQHRPDDALRSLQWLRGWVSPKAVSPEFTALTVYVEQANACDGCRRQEQRCTHSSTFAAKMRELVHGRTMRPFVVLTTVFAVTICSGSAVVLPFLVQLVRTLRMPVDPNWATVIVGLMNILANLFMMLFVRIFGKRRIFLGAVAISVCVCFGLSVNAYMYVPAGVSSFDDPQTLADGGAREVDDNWVALVLIVVLAFVAGVSMNVPWCLISEVYPLRIRGIICGISAATNYFIVFVGIKTYIDLERSVSIAGTFLLYGILSSIGFVLQYLILPETEGHTLEEIELYFSDSTRRITNRKIRRSPAEMNVAGREIIGLDNRACDVVRQD